MDSAPGLTAVPALPDGSDPVLSTVATLRRQLSGLLDRIDTAALPAPDKINPTLHKHAGLEWHPVGRTLVRVLDEDDDVPCVYLEPDGWSGDWIAMPPASARRLAMALIAAADRVDQKAASIPTINRPA